MTREGEFNEVMELLNEYVGRNTVYINIEGDWLNFELERYTVSCHMWQGIVAIWDRNEHEEIYRVE